MDDTADQPIRKTVSLPASVWKQIEDFRFENRIGRETEAIRRLVEIGLNAQARERQHRAASVPSQLEQDAEGHATFQRVVKG